MQEKENGQFSFINEQRKEKPINKKKLFIYAVFIVVMAIVAGLLAGGVFAYFEPRFSKMFYPEQKPVVTIPRDSIETEESEGTEETEEARQDDTSVTEEMTEEETSVGEETVVSTESGSTESETEETTEAEPMPVPEPVPVPQELTIADYQKFLDVLYEVGRESAHSVVTVTGVKNGTDRLNHAYESRGQGTGLIIADNGGERLILTERRVIADANEIYVTFNDGATVKADVKKYDGNTGITVLFVPLAELSEETMENTSVAVLGNSFAVKQGMLTIALERDSILTGNITSTAGSIAVTDNKYAILTTDIVWDRSGNGVLLNVSGEVIGLIVQSFASSGDGGTLAAISISEIKGLIEMLSNEQDIPYIGLELTTVTNDIAEEYDIPKGAYVREVKIDSPGMAAGLQSGDVIVEMNGDAIFTVDGYKNKLFTLIPGQETEIVVQRQGNEGYAEITCEVEIGVSE